MLIGVTGLIGSGKSAVATAFGEMGARVIDCDRLGRIVVETDAAVQSRLVQAFGTSILSRAGRIDRRQLGRTAFASLEGTAALNRIVHPPLLALLDAEIARTRREYVDAAVDAALLIYWKYHRKMDYTVLVTATAERRRGRLLTSGLTAAEIRQRTAAQMSEKALRACADFVITNNKDLASLRTRAKKLYTKMSKMG